MYNVNSNKRIPVVQNWIWSQLRTVHSQLNPTRSMFDTSARSASTNPGREPLDEAPLPVLVVGSQLKASTKGEAVNNAMDGSQVQPVVPIWIRYPINTQQGNLYPQQRRTTRPKCFHHVARRSTIGQVTGKRMSYGFGPRKHREANTSPNRTCQPHFPRGRPSWRLQLRVELEIKQHHQSSTAHSALLRFRKLNLYNSPTVS